MDGGGLYRFDGYDLRSFLPDPHHLQSSLSGSRIACILPVHDTLLYVGTTFGFSALNPVTGNIRNFNNRLDSMADWRIGTTWRIVRDTATHILWLGTRHGLLKFDEYTRHTESMRPISMPADGNMPEDLTHVVRDNRNTDILWLGGSTGFFRYTITTGTYRYHSPPSYGPERLFVSDILQDTTDVLLIATARGEVLRFNKVTEEWRTYALPPSVNFPDERRTVFKLLHAWDNTLWLSTYTGVGMLDLQTGRYEALEYSESNPSGLLPNGAYRGMMFDRHGRMWVASWHGIQYTMQTLMPAATKTEHIKPAIVDVSVSPILRETQKPLLFNGAIQLEKAHRDVTFQYVLPNPLHHNTVGYQYLLKGFDRDWIQTDQRKARYTNLRGGQYQFMIRARESESDPWTDPATLDVMIPKKVTELWWFWALLSLAIIAIIIAIMRYAILRVRKTAETKAAFENQLSEIQMQALRAQMNPHFLFNSLNSIKYYAISKTQQETAAYVSKFAMLVRAILNNSKSRTISLKDELDALRLYIEIEHLRLQGKFDYTLDIDGSLHIQQAQIPPMILQPYVENAIWHGLMHKEGNGRLVIQVKDLGTQIQCIIEDNGIGRQRAAELKKSQMEYKRSLGMQITGDRISLINRIYHIDTRVSIIDLEDGGGQPAGTRVVINIPLIHEDEFQV